MDLNKKTLIELYTTMLTIRRFEERAYREFYAGNLFGFVHSYIGQEAIATGVCAHLTKEDRIVSNHRGHGHCIAKGADMKKMMAEIYGKKTGYCKGKGGSMHIADFSIGMLGADGIVGAGLPIASGAAIAAQLEKKGSIAAVFFGDGACNEGEFHEALNLAGIWKLPLLFVCENNQYGREYTRKLRHGSKRYHANAGSVSHQKQCPFTAMTSRLFIRRQKKPSPFSEKEMAPFSWNARPIAGISIFYPRPLKICGLQEEIEAWKKKCPVAAFETKLLQQGVLTRADIESINERVLAQVDEACTVCRR